VVKPDFDELCVVLFSSIFLFAISTYTLSSHSSVYHRGSVLLPVAHLNLHLLHTYHCPEKRVVLAVVSLQMLKSPTSRRLRGLLQPVCCRHRDRYLIRWDWPHRQIDKMFFICVGR